MTDSIKIKNQAIFGKSLKQIRKEKGFSQEFLALKCELDRTYISSVERGERNISLINIIKIANALECKPEDFFLKKNYI